jgi:hypothetical protein
MLMMPNSSPTQMMGAVEGLAQKFAYYGWNQYVRHRDTWIVLTSARNLPRCRKTRSQGELETVEVDSETRPTGVESIKVLRDISINHLSGGQHGQYLIR